MNVKILNKFLSLGQREDKQQIVCQINKGGLSCHLASINDNENKISFSMAETLNFLEKLDINQVNESTSVKIKLADKYYNLTINLKNDQEISIHIYNNKPELRSLTHLGFNRDQLKIIKKSLKLKQGLIILTGPPLSGKTSTYYSFLESLNNSEKLIYSIEKYPSLILKNTNQIKFKTSIFAKIKTSDAQIVGFDQVENYQELQELLYLANSGRLVIACLNEDKAVNALNYITKSQLNLNLITKNLKTIISQKLLRKNCPKCLTKTIVNNGWLKRVSKSSNNLAKNLWYNSLGCPACNYSGKDTKMACFEIMNIASDASLKPGFEPLICDAVKKANNGIFSPEEISQLLK